MLPWILKSLIFQNNKSAKIDLNNEAHGTIVDEHKNSDDSGYFQNRSPILTHQELTALRIFWDELSVFSSNFKIVNQRHHQLIPIHPPPFHILPTMVLYQIICYLNINSSTNKKGINVIKELMLVSKSWADAILDIIYFKPLLTEESLTVTQFSNLLTSNQHYHPLNTALSHLGNQKYPTSSFHLFSYGHRVRDLELTGSVVEDIYPGDLELILSKLPNLESFVLINCFHTSNLLVQTLADHCPYLVSVNLSGCPISDKYIQKLCLSCENIEELLLANTRLSLNSLFTILKWCRHLNTLDFSNVDLSDEPSDSLTFPNTTSTIYDPKIAIPAVKENLQTNSLSIDLKNINSDTFNSSITWLSLSNTKISETALKLVLTKSPCLVYLDVSYNICLNDNLLQFILQNCQLSHLEHLNILFCTNLSEEALDCISYSSLASRIKNVLGDIDAFAQPCVDRMLTLCPLLDHEPWKEENRSKGWGVEDQSFHWHMNSVLEGSQIENDLSSLDLKKENFVPVNQGQDAFGTISQPTDPQTLTYSSTIKQAPLNQRNENQEEMHFKTNLYPELKEVSVNKYSPKSSIKVNKKRMVQRAKSIFF